MIDFSFILLHVFSSIYYLIFIIFEAAEFVNLLLSLGRLFHLITYNYASFVKLELDFR